jgi:hypothetical protein
LSRFNDSSEGGRPGSAVSVELLRYNSVRAVRDESGVGASIKVGEIMLLWNNRINPVGQLVMVVKIGGFGVPLLISNSVIVLGNNGRVRETP